VVPSSQKTYQALFHPEKIVVVGASNDLFKPGGRLVKHLRENPHPTKLWAVNAKHSDIQGLPTYPKIADLPDSPDLALITIPAMDVLPALESLADKNTKAAIIMTAGFGEKGEKGRDVERRMLEIV
jgi:acetate---CoA ligase (ADP-forming)